MNNYFNTEITIELNDGTEVDIEVKCWYNPGEPQTYWEPGSPFEIEDIEYEGDDFPEEMQDTTWNELNDILYDYLEDQYDTLLDAADEAAKEYEYDRAEYLYECRQERLYGRCS